MLSAFAERDEMSCVAVFFTGDYYVGKYTFDIMTESKNLCIFVLESKRHAINLDLVERVIRAVEITPLPISRGNVSGVINLHGVIVPVVDTRRMLGVSERAIEPDDVFVIVRTGLRTIALVADSVEHAVSIPVDRITPIGDIVSGEHLVTGITHLGNDVIMIHDLERCISSDEFMDIERALDEG